MTVDSLSPRAEVSPDLRAALLEMVAGELSRAGHVLLVRASILRRRAAKLRGDLQAVQFELCAARILEAVEARDERQVAEVDRAVGRARPSRAA